MKKIWIIVAIACVIFILIQSILPENKSANESRWFTTYLVNPVLSIFGIKTDKDTVRKIAHIVEFCILSSFVFLLLKKKSGKTCYAIIRTFYTGFTIAFLDESLQILTRRGALVTDIWIDIVGVFIGIFVGLMSDIIIDLKGR